MRFGFLLLALALLAGRASGQEALEIALPDDLAKIVWLSSGVPSSLPEKPDPAAPQKDGPRWATGKHSFQPPEKGVDHLAVWDPAKGVVAAVPISALKASPKVLEEDFLYYDTVTVRVQGKNGPPASGLVRLKDAVRQQEALLAPEGQGEVRFSIVRKGEVTVSGMVSSGGKTYEFSPKKFVLDEAAPGQVEGARLLAVAVPVDVDLAPSAPKPETPRETAQANEPQPAEAAPRSSDQREPAPGGGGSPWGGLLGALLGVVVAGAALWFGIRLLAQRRDWVQSKLREMGVQAPEAPQPGPPPPPTAPRQPEPPQTIQLQPAAAAVSNPRLIASDGTAFAVPEGVTEVGREAQGLTLASEPTVSRRHAQLERSGGRVVVRDLGSTNGTAVNGVMISGDTELKPGDTVQFGAARFRFEG
ncbi:MAG: FHA domain-containing protein [Fimbriimonadales bacterium]|nr:FHA domain-containing protein [Fimbriimonadales bacterium]